MGQLQQRIVGLFIPIVVPFFALSQGMDLGTWNVLNVKYKHSKQLSFFAEGQLRSLKTYNQFHYHEYKGGVNFHIHQSAVFTLAAGSYQTYKEGGNFVLPKNNDEFRLWPQIVLTQKFTHFKIEQRYRAEMRWTNNGYRNRFRYRLGIAYPFGKKANGDKAFQLNLNNELFFTDREPYFERNRIQLTLNYKLSQNASIQAGYLHQFDYRINDETGRDFMVIGFYYEFLNKKMTKQ
jgi:hypothetical protein